MKKRSPKTTLAVDLQNPTRTYNLMKKMKKNGKSTYKTTLERIQKKTK